MKTNMKTTPGPMNEHIYIDKGVPLVSLFSETLSDGSCVFNLQFNSREVGAIDERRGRMAMQAIRVILAECCCADVLHL